MPNLPAQVARLSGKDEELQKDTEVFETAVESNQAVVPKACEKRNIRSIRNSCRVEPGGGLGLNS